MIRTKMEVRVRETASKARGSRVMEINRGGNGQNFTVVKGRFHEVEAPNDADAKPPQESDADE